MGVHSIPLNQSHERHAMTGPQPTWPTTTNAGIPVESDEHSLTIGPDGPIQLHDHYLIEQMAAFNPERVPERQPHAKGSGASR
jgi:catalase